MTILHRCLLACAVLLLVGSARASSAKEEGFSDLTIDQVSDLIAKKEADIFDNNSKEDYAKGHLPTARWVSFKDVKESDLPTDKSRKLVFYCANTH
ncbi:MAG TPA: rhodanese-like domain-containing protein [Myxococcales bacterium]|nr:rhodanese-like domain-containing protein [Myxococcales bacterium]